MSAPSLTYRVALAGTLVLPVAGCDPGSSSLSPVQGQVRYHGLPVAGGTIVFAPDAARGNAGPLARADLQADGGYSLSTAGAPGAAAGWYRVTVVAVQAPAPGPPFAAPHSLLPEKYRDPDLSGLTCEVKAGRSNLFHFNLD
jgi:hypothetical protein